MANPKSFRKTIDAEAKRAGLNDEQIKLLYILNGIESRSGTATESAYYSRDRMFEKFGGSPDSSLGRYATRMGWYDENGEIVGESVTTANGKTIPKELWEWAGSVHTANSQDVNGGQLSQSVIDSRQQELFNVVYSGRIGNTEDDDGWTYRGRGGVQLTGRSNYENVTRILNRNGIDIDLVANPELAADERYSAAILVAFCEHRGMFDPNSPRYIGEEDIEKIKAGDADAIDKLHNITNPQSSNDRLTRQAADVYDNTDGDYNITDGVEGNQILSDGGRDDINMDEVYRKNLEDQGYSEEDIETAIKVLNDQPDNNLKNELLNDSEALEREISVYSQDIIEEGDPYLGETPLEPIETEIIEEPEIKSFPSLQDVPAGIEDESIMVDGTIYNKSEDGLNWESQETFPVYKVQIGVSVGEPTGELKEKIEKLKAEGYLVQTEFIKGELNAHIVTVPEDGPLYNKSSADKLLEEITELGVEDSFIKAEKDGERISVEDAMTMEKPAEVDTEEDTESQVIIEEEVVEENEGEIEVAEEDTEEDEVTTEDETTVVEEEDTPVVEEGLEVESVEDEKSLEDRLRDKYTKESIENYGYTDESELTEDDKEWIEYDVEYALNEINEYGPATQRMINQNPELAEKYKGMSIEDVVLSEDFEEDFEERFNVHEEILDEERELNKLETGVLETNKERKQREADIAEYNTLQEKKNDGTASPEDLIRIEEIEGDYGNWNPEELYQTNVQEESERDANEAAGRGRLTNEQYDIQEAELRDLEEQRNKNEQETGIRETDDEKSERLVQETEEEKKVEWSDKNSETELRNDLKTKLSKIDERISVAENEDDITALETERNTLQEALEYLELKKNYDPDGAIDLNTLNRAIQNNDITQLNMWYNDAKQQALGTVEEDYQKIQDGTFTGSEEEKTQILNTYNELSGLSEKTTIEQPTEGEQATTYNKRTDEYVDISTDPTVADKIFRLKKDGDRQDIQDFNTYNHSRKRIIKENEATAKVVDLAKGDETSGFLTKENTTRAQRLGLYELYDMRDGQTYYVSKEWLDKKMEPDMTGNDRPDDPDYNPNYGKKQLDVEYSQFRTSGWYNANVLPQDRHMLQNGLRTLDYEQQQRLNKILALENVDGLTEEQIELLDKMKDPNYLAYDPATGTYDADMLATDIDAIYNIDPEAFEVDPNLDETETEDRSQGPTGQDILKSTVDAAQGIMSAFGGPEALVNAVMGKKALAAAMKDVTPEEQARLSPMFYEHLRETKELAKQGYHPEEELKIRTGIDKAYQQGLDNSVRGTAGDRAKFLANSGILDAKRSLALLEFANQDAALQRENQKQYSDLLLYKENFDSVQKEAKRTENLQMQLANKKAASEFAGLTFANAMGSMGSSNTALLDLIKKGTEVGGYLSGFNLQNPLDNTGNNNTNTTEE